MTLDEKIRRLDNRLRELGSVMVAFSGGVDSTALLHACRRVLGKDSVFAVIADSDSLPRAELEEAVALGRSLDVHLDSVQTRELDNADYRKNAPDRCYFCKKELFSQMERIAGERGVRSLLYGAIEDDLLEARPGSRAAGEFAVCAPLQECGFSKEEVREYCRRYGLPNAEKPAFACLSSRVPHGIEVDAPTLRQVERAEGVLRELGYLQYRVRHHGEVARIELEPQDLHKALDFDCERIQAGVRSAGYRSVLLDLNGYRRGAVLPGICDRVFWESLPRRNGWGLELIGELPSDLEKKLRGKIRQQDLPEQSLSYPLTNSAGIRR